MTGVPGSRPLLSNRALSQARTERRLSVERLACLVCSAAASRKPPIRLGARENVTRHIKRIESGKVRVPGHDYRSLLCEVLGQSEGELFGEVIRESSPDDMFLLDSHKFFPSFVGCVNARKLIEYYRLRVDEQDSAAQRYSGLVDNTQGTCRIYVYSFGVALYHQVEPLVLPSIAELARWRQRSYLAALQWSADQLSSVIGDSLTASYVLSLYHLRAGKWGASHLQTAMRLLAMPRVLLGEAATEEGRHAEQVEAALLRAGFSHPDIADFGVMGLSIGCATWGGISYHPLAPGRALPVNDLVEVELLVQALWCYCHHILDRVGQGHDPVIPDEHGFRLLRGLRSRCFTTRPQESSQHRSMRAAILAASNLGEKLKDALEILQDMKPDRPQ